MNVPHLEVWFDLNSGEDPRASGLRALVRFETHTELHDATIGFEGG
jgi:hypothetical protein